MKTLAELLEIGKIEAELRRRASTPDLAAVTDANLEAQFEKWRNGIPAGDCIVTPETIEMMRHYIAANRAGRALLLTGKQGTGKTRFFRNLRVKLLYARDVAAKGFDDLEEMHVANREKSIVIDDLGSERVAFEYGAKDEILRDVIDKRYCSRITGVLTHITTNLSAEDIAKRYGDRTLSRIMEMCHPYAVDGSDWRVPASIPRKTNKAAPSSLLTGATPTGTSPENKTDCRA